MTAPRSSETRVTYDSATGRCGVWPLRWAWALNVREHHHVFGTVVSTTRNGWSFTQARAERAAQRAIAADQLMRGSIRSRITEAADGQ